MPEKTEVPEIEELLAAVDRGERGAFDRLVEAVYPELKKIAHFQLAAERPGHSLNTTAVVHEAFLRLSRNPSWNDRGHFLRASAKVMRHLLVDHARKAGAQKRGAGAVALTLHEHEVGHAVDGLAVLELERAMEGMSAIDPRLVEIVECRFFAGLSVTETAEALATSERTVERGTQRARAYLLRSLGAGD